MIVYRLVQSCPKCTTTFTEDEVLHSHGVCPNCGHDSGSTVLDVVRTSVPVSGVGRSRIHSRTQGGGECQDGGLGWKIAVALFVMYGFIAMMIGAALVMNAWKL